MFNPNPPKHIMNLIHTFPSNAQEWLCQICGRRFIMHFQDEPPKLEMIILEEGNKLANHTGAVSIISEVGNLPAKPNDDPELSQDLRDALDDIDLGFDPDPFTPETL